jgi:hypothetical protein
MVDATSRARSRSLAVLTFLLQVVGMSALAAGCHAPGKPVSPERLRLEERRLLQPFSLGGQVGAGELIVEMTPNFYAVVGQPAKGEFHGFSEEEHEDYVEKVWFNKIGDYRGRFTVEIGPQSDVMEDDEAGGKPVRFVVVQRIVHRIYRTEREMTLNVVARGRPVVLQQQDSDEVQELLEARWSDGLMQAIQVPR